MWTLVITMLLPLPEFTGARYTAVAFPRYATNTTVVTQLPSREMCERIAESFLSNQPKENKFGDVKKEFTCTSERTT